MFNNPFSIGSPFAELVMWIYGTISVLLVFSPFVYLGYRKWRRHLPISWWMVFLAYIISPIIFWVWSWWIWGLTDSLLQKYYSNSWWITNALLEGGAGPFFGVIVGWPALIFYVVWIKFEHFTLKSFLLSTTLAIVMFMALAGLAAYLIAWGLGNLA